MTFEKLPDNWSEIPLWDNDLADVVDLFLGIEDRINDTLLLLATDDDGAAVPMPVSIHHINWDDNPATHSGFAALLRDLAALGSHVLVAFGHSRPGPSTQDLHWRAQLTEMMHRHGLTPIDFYTADPDAVRRVPEATAFVA